MDSFDQFITDCISDSINARYTSNDDGTWVSGPCGVCGSQVYFFPGDVPECLPCFREAEAVEVGAVTFDLALNRLGELVRDTKGEQARKRLSEQLALWSLTLALWSERTA